MEASHYFASHNSQIFPLNSQVFEFQALNPKFQVSMRS